MRRALSLICCVIAGIGVVAGQQGTSVPVAKISLPNPAYIGMPIWLQVESPTGYKIHYPSTTTPNDFDCYEVEVQNSGPLVRPLIGLPAAGRSGPACGWLAIADIAESKLPIHLQYRLTEPGTYMVRFTRREYRRAKVEIAEQSAWVPLRLEVAPPGAIEHWLSNQLAALPNSPGRLLGDALPSLLASHDPRVLRLMIDFTYNGESTVSHYAANSLMLFDPDEVRPQLLSVVRERGPNDALGYLFDSSGSLVLPIAPQIVAATLPRLRSAAPLEVLGAVHVLSIMRKAPFQLPSETVAQIVRALEGEVDFVIAQKNEGAAWWIANFLGQTRPPVGRTLLWKLADARLSTEQSLICITWYRDPSDLPRLAAMVREYNPSDPHGYQHSAIVDHMWTEYGSAARPFLRDVLLTSKQTWVRTAAAQGLAEMNDRAGWEFFIDVVKKHPFYRDEMVRWLQDRFSMPAGSDDTLIAFLESRAAAGQ
jgi:hypothetical protein